MKKMLATIFLTGIFYTLFSQSTPSINIIPLPVSTVAKTGTFTITNKTVIQISSSGADANRVASFLSEALAIPAGYKLPVTNKTSNAAIHLNILSAANKTLGDEGYKLSVSPSAVTVSANKPAGLFYGVQTIL